MKIRLNPLMLGSFILGAVILVVVALLVVGTRNPFRPKGHFVLFLPASAQGLDKGTAVSFNGVRVGQINELKVVYDAHKRQAQVYVLCQIDQARVADAHNRPIRLTERRVLTGLIHEGLRAQIQTAGVVGAKFVNLGFYDTRQYPLEANVPKAEYPVVPSLPSTMTEMTETASRILANLRQADFAAIAQQVREVLAAVNRQVAQLETNRLSDHLASAAESIHSLAGSTNIQAVLLRVQDAAASLNLVLTNLNGEIIPLGGKVAEALAQSKGALGSVNQTAQELQDFLALRNQLGEQTRELVEQLTETARRIERLAGFLEEHPNALITGRSEPSASK